MKPGENPLEADQGHVIGTPHFIAPEQAALSPAIDFQADMYSLGTVLYFMLTGTSPFEGRDNYEILEQQVGGQIPIRAISSAISPCRSASSSRA